MDIFVFAGCLAILLLVLALLYEFILSYCCRTVETYHDVFEAVEPEEDPEEWRQQARDYSRRRENLLRYLRHARNRDNDDDAKRYEEQAHDLETRMREANKTAAEIVFCKNNPYKIFTVIDLHGLLVNEAIQHLNDRIVALKEQRSPMRPSLLVEVITALTEFRKLNWL